jgi:hypothetical protein
MSDRTDMPSAPNKKHPTIVRVAFLAVIPPSIRYFFDDGNILNKDEKIYIHNQQKNILDMEYNTYHYAERQTQAGGEETIAVLDLEVSMPRELADH